MGLPIAPMSELFDWCLLKKTLITKLEEIDIFQMKGGPDDYLKLHPFGKVPTLQKDDFILYETSAITRYLDEIFPETPLQPVNPQQRARMPTNESIVEASLPQVQ